MGFENQFIKPRESGVEKVVDKKYSEEDFLSYFEEAYKKHRFHPETEKEKSESQLKLIENINREMQGFVERYEGRFLNVNPQNIHVLDEKKLKPEHWNWLKERFDIGKEKAAYGIGSESIICLLFKGEDLLVFAKTLVHEIMHFNSFQSMDVEWKDEYKEGEFFERKSGFAMSIEDEQGQYTYFSNLNEAITEELTVRFCKEFLCEFDELKESFQNRQIIMDRTGTENDPLEIYINSIRKSDGTHRVKFGTHTAYKNERQYLDDLIIDIQEKNKEKFKTKEDVFVVFAKAYFTGRILEVARLIEGTYGKGSFRKIGRETAKIGEKKGIEFSKKKQ